MDLSKVPDLELRQKIKPINDRIAAINAQIDAMHEANAEKLAEATKVLRDEGDDLEDVVEKMISNPDRWVEGTCCRTGLPIFNDDDTKEEEALACVYDEAKAVA